MAPNPDGLALVPRTPSRRRFLSAGIAGGAVLGLGGLLTACGSSGGSGGSGGATPGSGGASADQKSVKQGGDDYATVIEKMKGFGTDAAPGVYPRTVKHAMGETVIPAKPTRVVVLDTGELDNVVSLGIQPVGIVYTDGSKSLPSYLKDKAGNPANVGTINSLNLEAIAALKPDLILGSQLRAQDQYAQLSKIAPTVFSLRPGYPWKQNFQLNASPFGLEAEAKAQLDAYQAAATAIGTKLGDKRPTVTPLRFMPGRTRLYAELSFIGTILTDVPLPQPKIEQVKELAVEISPEQIDKADADWIFYGVYGTPSSTNQDAVLGGALWKTLGAVKSGQARPVSDETWFLGLGVMAANAVLVDLKGFVAPGT
ncbi:iron complex transport system substrate-binding protein [Kitasatospora sp. MAA19]|uniref:ABC transporter substrate-binding protein n=1 Tax=Kitasatospora sp. MAA19 TaxID=3035090 RepID=UPI00247692AE|nr:iron-siderophore ABC transporter substrate-binding protein [Kitasatospora sp. MAA19]MDH6706967.1 iron complex transport system substrate-binding protein [Kitasatospora sp. MAA19]